MEVKKIIIYQVLPRLFNNNNYNRKHNGNIQTNGCGKLNDFTFDILNSIKELGITHIWYTGIIEHATTTDYTKYGIKKDHPLIVKGKAGSPYAIKDYYDIDPDIATDINHRIDEFKQLIKRTHQAGLKVIIDFVPNHVARQYHSDVKPNDVMDLGEEDDTALSFSPNNNFYYIPNTFFNCEFDLKATKDDPYHEDPTKVTGNNKFDASPSINDWYDTIKLNYGIDYLHGGVHHFNPTPDTWIKMRDILLYWSNMEVDGFRCDMAEMIPVEFWEWLIPQIKFYNQDIIFIAEIYKPELYKRYIEQGHFDFLYDKVGLYDTLHNIICGYGSASTISLCWQNLNGLEKNMLNFLENHDEQRIASDFFAKNAWSAIPAIIIAACMNTNPFMIYFAQELGERGMDNEGFSGIDGRTSIFDYWSLLSLKPEKIKKQKELHDTYKKILTLCNKEKAICEGAFYDLTYANINGWKFNEHKQFAFMRKHNYELLFIVANFDCEAVNIAVNIPPHAFDFLHIPQKDEYLATDLLTNQESTISLLPYRATEISVNKYSGKILKINLQ